MQIECLLSLDPSLTAQEAGNPINRFLKTLVDYDIILTNPIILLGF